MERSNLDKMAQHLGYRSYSDYLRGDHWRSFRRENLSSQCACCKRTVKPDDEAKFHLHHITYQRLGHELPRDVVTLCETCHSGTHDLIDNSGVQLSTAHLVFKKKVGKKIRKELNDPLTKGLVDTYEELLAYLIRNLGSSLSHRAIGILHDDGVIDGSNQPTAFGLEIRIFWNGRWDAQQAAHYMRQRLGGSIPYDRIRKRMGMPALSSHPGAKSQQTGSELRRHTRRRRR